MSLSPIQQEIVDLSGNLIVRASAGTGKTHTMVSKIVCDIEKQHSHKVIAAITFTVKAAREIKERLTIDIERHFIGTNNSFAIEEIIKPFMKDVYGMEYKVDMSTDYSIKVDSFQEGIEKIRTEKILCSYRENKKNFIFQLALDIMKQSQACQLYLQSKYFKIYIDEYQDCDRHMHDFFMYICEELKIDTFVVGDEKLLLGDLWAVAAVWIMETLLWNPNAELYLTLFIMGGLAVLIGETFSRIIYTPSWLCGWAIGLTIMGPMKIEEIGTLPIQIGAAMLAGVIYVGIGVDAFQKMLIHMLIKKSS